MRPVSVGNAWNTIVVQVRAATIKGCVSLAVETTSFSFWHMMSTDQARQMATALIRFSDIQDAKVAKAE